MTLVTINAEANLDTMHGFPGAGRPDREYKAPVYGWRLDFVQRAAKQLFSFGREVRVVGARWDYDTATDPIHQTLPIGHYLVHCNEGEFVLGVNLFEADRALELGDEFFEYCERAEGVKTLKPYRKTDRRYVECVEADDGTPLYVHAEEYTPCLRLADVGIDGLHGQIGTLAGKVFNAADAMCIHSKNEILRYSEIAGILPVRQVCSSISGQCAGVLEILKDFMGFKSIEDKGLNPYRRALGLIGDDIAGLLEGGYSPCHGNFTDEAILAEKEGGRLILSGCDAPSLGGLPMMTENGTYDLGRVVSGVILNPELYAPEGASVGGSMKQGLETFLAAYNRETNLGLGLPEALLAGKRAAAFRAAFEMAGKLGILTSAAPPSGSEAEHIASSMVMLGADLAVLKSLERIYVPKSLLPSPASLSEGVSGGPT